MGNCCHTGNPFNPGEVLDRVIANAEPPCDLYELSNFKKGGLLIEQFSKNGSKGVNIKLLYY